MGFTAAAGDVLVVILGPIVLVMARYLTMNWKCSCHTADLCYREQEHQVIDLVVGPGLGFCMGPNGGNSSLALLSCSG